MQFYGTKTKVDAEGKPISIHFQYPNGSYKVRKIEDKSFYTEGDIAQGGLFGRDKFSAGSHKFVTITEGELDAQSLYQAIHSPVVSVRSSTTAAADCGLDRSWLSSFDRIYLCFDNDRAGREAASSVARLFDYNRVFQVKLSKRKDANEYLMAGEADELKHIWWNSSHYLPETIVSSFEEFEEILNSDIQWGFPYPWKILTDMTNGIRTSESVLITAMEGVGKTEFMHALEYKFLKETNDNVASIFLEEPKRRHLQAIAGLELGRPAHILQPDLTQADVMAAVRKAISSDGRYHLYNHFGSVDPDLLLDSVRFLVTARGCRRVFCDGITLGVSGLQGEDERKALDYLTNRLEMMVKELDFSLIFSSHVNDNGQTRGSRNTSKVADIRIDLSRDLTSDDNTVRNTTNIVVSKNRFCGRTGPAGQLLFNPLTYAYVEVANDNDPVKEESLEAA
jgi:twinkle protein